MMKFKKTEYHTYFKMVVVSRKATKVFERILKMRIRAIAFYPFIFMTDERDKNNVELINHEKIHLRQQLEMLVIPFYVWYLIEFFIKGYWNVSFEREAYANEKDLHYLKKRRMFSFIKYIKK